MKLRLGLLALLAGVLPLSAEPAPPAAVEAHYREVAQRPEFQETADLDSQPSWQDRAAQWLRHFGSSFDQFKYAPQMSKLAATLFTGLTLVALVGILYVSARVLRRQYERRRTGEAIDPPRATESAAEPDLAQTVAEGHWRAAWRIVWRQFLFRLEASGLVAADRTRTNREYLAQLDLGGPPSPAAPLLAGDGRAL